MDDVYVKHVKGLTRNLTRNLIQNLTVLSYYIFNSINCLNVTRLLCILLWAWTAFRDSGAPQVKYVVNTLTMQMQKTFMKIVAFQQTINENNEFN